MAAYRTATRLFSGCCLPWLGIGMEYLRTNHLTLAEQYIRQAHALAPGHPAVIHELGTVLFLKGEYSAARATFELVADNVKSFADLAREPSVFMLGHCFRKLGQFERAVRCYESSLGMKPNAASTYAALGFTHHLAGKVHEAIVNYHQALSLRPDDTLTAELLTRALEESTDEPPPLLGGEMSLMETDGGRQATGNERTTMEVT